MTPPELLIIFIVAAIVAFTWLNCPSSSTLPSLKSYIPWFGCAFQYIRNPREFLKRARAKCGPTYTFPMAGKRFLVLTAPEAIARFLRDNRSFGHVEHRGMGVIAGVRDPARVARLADVFEHELASLVIRYFTVDRELEQRFTARLFARIDEMCNVPEAELLGLVGNILYQTLSGEVFGNLFPSQDYATFKAYDEVLPAAFLHLPFSGRQYLAAYNRFAGVFYDFLQKAWREGPADGTGYLEGASEFMSDSVRTLKDQGLCEEEVVGLLMAFTWGAHSNLILSCYWLIVNILSDTQVKARVCEEIRSHGVLASKDSPLLQSAFQETMRFVTTPSTVREALVDLQIADIPICKGDIVIADVRAMHFDPDVHDSPETFVVDRFVSEPPSPRKPLFVWGGGTSLCKGRYFAQFAVKSLVVGLLERYHVDLVKGSTLAKTHPHDTVIIRPVTSASISLRRRKDSRF